jgi:hypothetical protein
MLKGHLDLIVLAAVLTGAIIGMERLPACGSSEESSPSGA